MKYFRKSIRGVLVSKVRKGDETGRKFSLREKIKLKRENEILFVLENVRCENLSNVLLKKNFFLNLYIYV